MCRLNFGDSETKVFMTIGKHLGRNDLVALVVSRVRSLIRLALRLGHMLLGQISHLRLRKFG